MKGCTMKLKNQTAIITGASSGLGEFLAYKLSLDEGAHVILIARTENLLKKVVDKIQKEGGQAEYQVCDISDSEQVKVTVKKILNQHKKIDILINNAGVWTDNSLEETRPELRKAAFETNSLGNIQFTEELLPIFEKQNNGQIFNVISGAGIHSGNNVFWKTYGATKWAMTGYTKALRESLAGTKIKVIQFYPGGFESNLYEKVGRPDAHNQPWMMKTEDIADVVVFALTRPDDLNMEEISVSKMK
jgi:NADP-dependent 3-hydroxy acid dehydrogenase YdfG